MSIQRKYAENKETGESGYLSEGKWGRWGAEVGEFFTPPFMDLSNFVPYDNENKKKTVLHLKEPSHHNHHFANICNGLNGLKVIYNTVKASKYVHHQLKIHIHTYIHSPLS